MEKQNLYGTTKKIKIKFSDENNEYVRIMSKLCGKSMTDFVNDVVTRARCQNADVCEAAKVVLQYMRDMGNGPKNQII